MGFFKGLDKVVIGMTGAGINDIPGLADKLDILGVNKNQEKRFAAMVGLITSYRVLSHHYVRKKGAKSVTPTELKKIVETYGDRLAIFVHHYSKDRTNFLNEITTLLDGIEGNCPDGIQMNFHEPELWQLETLKEKYPKTCTGLILQVKRCVYVNGVQAVIDYVGKYSSTVGGVLIDPSEGRGEQFDTTKTMQCMKAVDKHYPSLVLGIAGGLCADNVAEKLRMLLEHSGNIKFGIDAESGLRTGDYFDITKAIQYVKNAVGAYNEFQ